MTPMMYARRSHGAAGATIREPLNLFAPAELAARFRKDAELIEKTAASIKLDESRIVLLDVARLLKRTDSTRGIDAEEELQALDEKLRIALFAEVAADMELQKRLDREIDPKLGASIYRKNLELRERVRGQLLQGALLKFYGLPRLSLFVDRIAPPGPKARSLGKDPGVPPKRSSRRMMLKDERTASLFPE
jgi:hypothetical protein